MSALGLINSETHHESTMNSRRLPISSLLLPLSLIVFGLSGCGAPSSEPSPNATQPDATQPDVTQPDATPEVATSESRQEPADTPAPMPSSASISPNKDACESAVTQTELNECAYQGYESVDAQQNQQYQATFEQLTAPGKADLIAADLAWREFRELDCSFARNQYAGGSIEPLIYYDCLAARSRTRLAELTSTSPEPPSEQLQDAAAADAALNQRYQDLLALLTAEKTEAITAIQLSWITYRDRNCDFETNHQDILLDQCLARMSQTRVNEINEMIEARSL